MIHASRLIIFTRYPEPGKTKTRLIPALGGEGAALLQRQLTEHTVAQARQLRCQEGTENLSIEICFTGQTIDKMQSWLGVEIEHQAQVAGDLGNRMARAFQTAFTQGIDHVVIIGIDCPDVDPVRLKRAFQSLQRHDLVLGPALDGGYYLIGLRRFVPELFQGIAWSTENVLNQTVAIAHQVGLQVAYLDPLPDIDYPEDLIVWQRVQTEGIKPCPPSLSVIIPTLNEAFTIKSVLTFLQTAPDVEVIVVDGGSQDETVEIAQSLGAFVLQTQPGRAHQMNVGASEATGDRLLFLHADTMLPEDWKTHIHQTLDQPMVVAGAFKLQIEGTQPGLRLVEWGVKWRSHLFQLPYGDQGIFLPATTFAAVGGFPDQPIMEDFELMRRLRRRGTIAIAPAAVLTSGRRWQKLGILRTTLINQLVILAYFLRIPLPRIAQWYRGRHSRSQTP